jgi:ABC-type multidrug transport system ATPase subunit
MIYFDLVTKIYSDNTKALEDINLKIAPHEFVSIVGHSGAGKSTLIKVLTGQLTPSEGKISYQGERGEIHVDDIYQEVSIAAPYIELIEEYTLNELIDFHFKFKEYLPGLDKTKLVEILKMEKSADKGLKFYSSGMKQRVKLALACCSQSSILFLDEPTSNMDVEGEKWYLDLLDKTSFDNRILIIGSNQEKEYQMCDHHIRITDYK